MDEVKRFSNPHHWFLRDPARMIAFLYTLLSQLTVLNAVTLPQTNLFSLFLRNHFSFICQSFWRTLDQTHFENFANVFTEHEVFPFLNEAEKFHSNYLDSLQIRTDVLFQLDFLPMMIIRAITANGDFDQMKYVRMNQ